MKFKITLLKTIMLDIDIDKLKKTLYNNDINLTKKGQTLCQK